MSIGYERRRAQTAEDDLAWFFGQSAAALGFKAQDYEGGGGHVFDAAASNTMHAGMLMLRRQDDVEKLRRIDAVIRVTPRETLSVLVGAFSPRAWDYHLHSAFARRRGNLAGVAVQTRAVVVALHAYQTKRQQPTAIEPSFTDIVVFLTDRATSARSTLRAIRTEAEQMLQTAVGVYESLATQQRRAA